jgi:hypothetical protein
MVVEKYSVNFKRQLELLWPSLVINSLTVLAYVFIIGLSAPMYIAVPFFLFFFLVNLLPVIILHTQYLIENKQSFLIINKQEKKIIYESNRQKCEVKFFDVTSLSYYCSYGRGS